MARWLLDATCSDSLNSHGARRSHRGVLPHGLQFDTAESTVRYKQIERESKGH